MWKYKKKLYFTLIEILMVLALLSLIVGVVAFNIRDLVGQQKFQNEVNALVDTLNRAQQLMLIYGQNTRVKFIAGPKGIQSKIEVDCLLDPEWEKWTTRHSTTYTHIHSLNFKDLTFPEKGGADRVIHFVPDGGGISRGIIGLSSQRDMGVSGGYDAYICLPGYAKAIKTEAKAPELCDENIDPQIALITRNEVLERVLNEK